LRKNSIHQEALEKRETFAQQKVYIPKAPTEMPDFNFSDEVILPKN